MSDKVKFQFDGLPDKETIFTAIIGEQGMGKTHFANTFPNPFFGDTEGRAHIVMKKFNNKNRKIVKEFDDLRQMALWCTENQPEGSTYVVDSGSDLRSLAEQEFLFESKLSKVYPEVLWGEVNAKAEGLMSLFREFGWNMVLTQRTKPKYVDKQVTDDFIPEGWSRIAYYCDIVLWLQKGIEFNGKLYAPDTVVARVVDNKWHPKGTGKPFLIDVSYDGIFKELKPEWTGSLQSIVDALQKKSEVEPINLTESA